MILLFILNKNIEKPVQLYLSIWKWTRGKSQIKGSNWNIYLKKKMSNDLILHATLSSFKVFGSHSKNIQSCRQSGVITWALLSAVAKVTWFPLGFMFFIEYSQIRDSPMEKNRMLQSPKSMIRFQSEYQPVLVQFVVCKIGNLIRFWLIHSKNSTWQKGNIY